MRKNKENNFAHKFRLLNSQECTDDINWSMSSSSEEENYTSVTFCNLTNQRRYIKRKRRKKAKNVSNLDITVIDTSSACTELKSPILCDKMSVQVSPVLGSKLLEHSPILVPRSSQKSPILLNSAKVNRKLFKNNNNESIITKNISPPETMCKNFVKEKSSNSCNNLFVEYQNISKTNASYTSDKFIAKNSKHDIYRNVKCFFDSNFMSDNASQNSISDATTPKDSILSDEVDISSGTPDHEATNAPIFVNKSPNEMLHQDIVKKMKYKKDGLAYRLNVLLKKQNASHSLWRHEKYLADNSNFVIPKEEHLPFRIKSTKCEYGCTMLNAVDENALSYCIVINNIYLSEEIECDSIVKIYKPYTMINCSSHTLVLNVCKYDLVKKIGEKY